jgi:hypothetical protein
MYRILQKYKGISEVVMENKESIYVIGFPKSGNTWLARLLAEVADSNMAASNEVDSADNSLNKKGKYVIYKEHVPEDIEKVLQCKVVYIVRDVRDVLVSWFFHCNRWMPHESARRNKLYRQYLNYEVKKSIKILRSNLPAELLAKTRYGLKALFHRRLEQRSIGGWGEHVLFWLDKPDVVVVKYEDLLKDTEGELRKVVNSLKLDVDCKRIPKVVFNQSFKKKKEGFQKSGDVKNYKFLRSGTSGSWEGLLYPSTAESIKNKYIKIMNNFDYL